MSIVFPKKFAIFQKRGFHVCQVCVVVAYAVCCHLHMLLYNELIVTASFDPQTNTTVESKACVLIGNSNTYIFWITLVNPIVANSLNMTLSILTIANIFKSRAKLKSSKSSSKDRKFAITIIAQNVSCVLCKTPLVIFFLVNSYLGLDFEQFEMYFTIFVAIYLIKNADSPLVNYLFNSIFKNEVLAFLRPFRSRYRSYPAISSVLSPSGKELTKFRKPGSKNS